MALYVDGVAYFTANDPYDCDGKKYIIPSDMDECFSKYIPMFLDEDSNARPQIKLSNHGLEDLKIVIHEAQLAINRQFPSAENGIEKYIRKWNDPLNYLGSHFFATDSAVYQFGNIDEVMYHSAAVKDGVVGNSYSVGIERTVDITTNYPRAIYNQAKCAASILKYYSLLYKSSLSDEYDFIANNVITHTEASTGLTLSEIQEGMVANLKLIYYDGLLSFKEIEDYKKIQIIPSIITNLDKRYVKICPARTIAGWYGGMATIKRQMLDNLYRYNNGDRNALFEEIVYNEDYLKSNEVPKRRLLKK